MYIKGKGPRAQLARYEACDNFPDTSDMTDTQDTAINTSDQEISDDEAPSLSPAWGDRVIASPSNFYSDLQITVSPSMTFCVVKYGDATDKMGLQSDRLLHICQGITEMAELQRQNMELLHACTVGIHDAYIKVLEEHEVNRQRELRELRALALVQPPQTDHRGILFGFHIVLSIFWCLKGIADNIY
ncbi:hypothetical protein VM1G_06586 [Cytospora mali]|uniref:Uncharacterized protein n=1 Tax=Cytospora mali TaxID=578113 RepID=A0A194W2H9_CYTMA|nr:hypothetical protein VM1G_06586 [Valsa mali]